MKEDLVFFIHFHEVQIPLACSDYKSRGVLAGDACLDRVPREATLHVEGRGDLASKRETATCVESQFEGWALASPGLNVHGFSVWPAQANKRVRRIAMDADYGTEMDSSGRGFPIEEPSPSPGEISAEERNRLAEALRKEFQVDNKYAAAIEQQVELDVDRDGRPDRLISAYLQLPLGPNASSSDGRDAADWASDHAGLFLITAQEPKSLRLLTRGRGTILATIDMDLEDRPVLWLAMHYPEHLRYVLGSVTPNKMNVHGCFRTGPGCYVIVSGDCK